MFYISDQGEGERHFSVLNCEQGRPSPIYAEQKQWAPPMHNADIAVISGDSRGGNLHRPLRTQNVVNK